MLQSKSSSPGIDAIRGKPPQAAAAAALAEAERLAGSGTWELIGVARVYYLSGNKARGQAIIDRVMSGKTDHNDWQRIGEARRCSPRPSPTTRMRAETTSARLKPSSTWRRGRRLRRAGRIQNLWLGCFLRGVGNCI